MKRTRIILACLVAVMLATVVAGFPHAAFAVTDQYVVGGRFVVNFDDAEEAWLFDLYTEFDKYPQALDGKMYAWPLAEQKMILRGKRYSDVDVSVDIATINPRGKFDSGIYVAASNAGNALDQITAWAVNIEHAENSPSFVVKLHRFLNGRWQGVATTSGSLLYTEDTINLRVVSKGGMLFAFLNHSDEPLFSYNVGIEEGLVGLRNYYSPNTFDNFVVIGEANAVDRAELGAQIALAEAGLEKDLLQACKDELNEALRLAELAVTQGEVDEAVEKLKQALARAVERETLEGLQLLLTQVDALTNENGAIYTENSWSSLQAVKALCRELTEKSGEYEICYWYKALEARINGLISFGAEVNS